MVQFTNNCAENAVKLLDPTCSKIELIGNSLSYLVKKTVQNQIVRSKLQQIKQL